jgi:hypothetical protein
MAKKLGEILLESGVIDRDQLSKALQRQVATGGRLGTNLVEMMLIDEIKLGEILSRQLSVPAVHPKVLNVIDAKVLQSLSPVLAEYYVALPFKLEGQRLHVAMLDPTNIRSIDELSHKSGYIIKSYICSENTLYMALSRHYRIPPPLRKTQVEHSRIPDVIVHDTSGMISLDEEGQFTLVDRADILGKHTKSLFLESNSRTAIVGYFLQFLSYTCDRVAFLAYDKEKNYLWRDSREFQSGKQGIVCGEQVNRSAFWGKYLPQAAFFYTTIPRPGLEMSWVKPMLDLDNTKAIFLAPLNVSQKVLGVAIGGSTASLRIEEELDTIKKLHMIAASALKIQDLRKYIETI